MGAFNDSVHCFGLNCKGKDMCGAYILISGPKLECKAGACGFKLCQKLCHLSVRVGEAKFSSTAAIQGNGGSEVGYV